MNIPTWTLIIHDPSREELDIVHQDGSNGEEAMAAFATANPTSEKNLVAAIPGRVELGTYAAPGISFPGDGMVKVSWLASQLAYEDEQGKRKERHKTLTDLLKQLRDRDDCQAEYLQISTSLPAHPWDDPTAEWWSTDAPGIIESIEELLATEEVPA